MNDLNMPRVSIIGISNVLNFKIALDPRVLSSLGEEEIVFPAYNAVELTENLTDRSKLAFQKGALDDNVIPLCAALAVKEHGDARKALDLLRRAGELAERRNSPTVTEDYVYFAEEISRMIGLRNLSRIYLPVENDLNVYVFDPKESI